MCPSIASETELPCKRYGWRWMIYNLTGAIVVPIPCNMSKFASSVPAYANSLRTYLLTNSYVLVSWKSWYGYPWMRDSQHSWARMDDNITFIKDLIADSLLEYIMGLLAWNVTVSRWLWPLPGICHTRIYLGYYEPSVPTRFM